MIKLKNCFFIMLLTFSVVQMHAMQKGLDHLRGKAYATFNPAILKDYEALGLDANATDREIKQAFNNQARLHHTDKGGNRDEFEKIKIAKDNIDNHIKNRTFFDLYIVGCLLISTTATVTGLIKAWHLYKEYSSPNAILLEKMELAADTAVASILNLEFDRYNPTKDTDALYMQFDIDALLVQLSSDEVRDKVKKAILSFDKTLEATYEQCAWHYDGMTAKALAAQNPRLVGELLLKLQVVKEAFKVCKKDLQLDRNKSLDSLKAHYKKIIGLGLTGSISWYAFKKFMTMQIIAPQGQPIIYMLPCSDQ